MARTPTGTYSIDSMLARFTHHPVVHFELAYTPLRLLPVRFFWRMTHSGTNEPRLNE